jgi:hypothetical protein
MIEASIFDGFDITIPLNFTVIVCVAVAIALAACLLAYILFQKK